MKTIVRLSVAALALAGFAASSVVTYAAHANKHVVAGLPGGTGGSPSCSPWAPGCNDGDIM